MLRQVRGARFYGAAVLIVVGLLATGSRPAAGGVRASAADLVPAAGVLFGAALPTTGTSQDTEAAMSDTEATLQRKLDLHRVYRLWDDPEPDDVVTTDVERGRTPVLSIKPKYRNGQQVSWAAIARGDADDMIIKQADGLAALPGPLLLSFHHEPDLSANSSYGTAADYVAAWRHYRQVFASRGATNVSFVWIVTTATFGKAGVTDTWYPGDDVVDWLAIDAFNWFGCSPTLPTGWRSFAQITAPFATWAKNHPKPLMLAEWGSVEDPAQPGRKAGWITDALAAAKNWPQLKAMSYLDAPGSCYWPVDSSPSAQAAFTGFGADSYAHPRPSALLVPSTDLGPGPLTVRFDASDSTGAGSASGTGVTGWAIDFGDGSAPASGTGKPSASVTHAYPVGVFTARLTIVDGTGQTDADQTDVRSAGPPVVTSGVRDVTGSGVTLRAWVSPQGLAGTAVFEWGTSTAYGQRSAPVPVGATTGTAALALPVGGLQPATRYYWRVSASTAAGTTVKASTVTTTAPPTLAYLAPSSLTASSVTLNGRVDPHSLDTRYYYDFGLTAGYGNRTSVTSLPAASSALPSPAGLTGLSRHRTYHYRLVAANAAGTVSGPDRTFATR